MLCELDDPIDWDIYYLLINVFIATKNWARTLFSGIDKNLSVHVEFHLIFQLIPFMLQSFNFFNWFFVNETSALMSPLSLSTSN